MKKRLLNKSASVINPTSMDDARIQEITAFIFGSVESCFRRPNVNFGSPLGQNPKTGLLDALGTGREIF